MGDLHADLVDMAGEHDSRLPFGIHDGHGIAVYVGTHAVRERGDLVAPYARRRPLEPRGPSRVEELLQKSDRR